MGAIALGLGGVFLAIYGARASTQTVARLVESRIGKPALVRETSRLNFRSLLHGVQSPMAAMVCVCVCVTARDAAAEVPITHTEHA